MATETLRGGRYVVTRVLGEGAQGSTFEAVDKGQGRLVAVKRFDVRGARAWKDVELAEREARVLASLSHPSLPAYIEHFEEDGKLYLVMEKIEGESLAARAAAGDRFGEADVIALLRDADRALEYLHAQGVVHRDLKPGNVIRRADGSFAFVDFGAVRDRFRSEAGSTVVGTFGFMAPEQFQGRALPASDVYAIAATGLSMLTGRPPEELPHKGLGIDVAAAIGGRASAGLTEALAHMLEPDPERRATRVEIPRARGPVDASPWTQGRLQGRRAAEESRREARRARREARRGGRFGPGARRKGPLPLFPAFFVLLALAAARVAVSVALFVVVPTVLTLLSVFFGPGLRRAARAVTRGGRRAYEAMDRQARDFTEDAGAEGAPGATDAAPRVRVDPDRLRVDDPAARPDEDAEEEEEERGRGRRRRG